MIWLGEVDIQLQGKRGSKGRLSFYLKARGMKSTQKGSDDISKPREGEKYLRNQEEKIQGSGSVRDLKMP